MAKKKPPDEDSHSLHIRLNAAEGAALKADLKTMPGIPVSPGAYAKHAVLIYPKLRKLEELIRFYCEATPLNSGLASDLLAEAGL